jgi:predicted DNA-binding transcriptional regulator YafY
MIHGMIGDRFLLILKQLRLGQPVRLGHLAKNLDVTTRTIIRDLDFLIYRLDWPIERTSKGVILIKPVTVCPECSKGLAGN